MVSAESRHYSSGCCLRVGDTDFPHVWRQRPIHSQIILRTYFSDANGLREGARVRLQGVDVGNTSQIRVVADPSRKLTPVEVTMEIGYRFRANLRTDSVTTLATEGVLGENYVDIDSSYAKGMEAENGDGCQLARRLN
jgi:phospholipid/cholesterol/gamma-HCH transport system substrate-binding protein